MITISIRKADFEELDVNRSTKLPVLDAIEPFWKKSQMDYDNFLKANNIKQTAHFSSLQELKDFANKVIDRLNAMADILKQNDFGFDFRVVNQMKSRYLKHIGEYDFIKLTFNLRDMNEAQKIRFKDLFKEIKSVSFIDFIEIDEESCALIYHKKGAMYYNDMPYIYTSKFSLSLLESFKVPHNNNFIMARFLFDLSKKLKENNIDEAFYVAYENGNSNTKSTDEIIKWANYSQEEKDALLQEWRENREIERLAKEGAQSELKYEANARRNSLDSLQVKQVIEQDKFIKTEPQEYSDEEIDELFSAVHIADKEKTIKDIEQENAEKIHKLVYQSIEYYKEKEIQKTNMRLERAQKDSQRAYEDLKKYIENGSSILEAVQNIKQKYSNEDTIHLATLLFNQDILTIKSKDELINELNDSIESLKNENQILNDKLDKKDETISSLKSTIQKKINEIQNFEYELRQEFDEQLQTKENEMLEKLETFKKSQDEIVENFKVEIEELNNENDELYKEKERLKEQNIFLNSQNEKLKSIELEAKELNANNYRLNAHNAMLENALKDAKSELESFKQSTQNKIEESDKIIKELYKIQAREDMYKEQIRELKERNQTIEQRVNLANLAPFAPQKVRATRSDKGKKRKPHTKSVSEMHESKTIDLDS